MKELLNRIKKTFVPCKCTDVDSYPNLHILACKDCGSVYYTQGTLRCLPNN